MKNIHIPTGKYHADIMDYGLMQTKAGKVTAYIKVKLEFGGNINTMMWFGGIGTVSPSGKPKSPRDNTVETFQKLNSAINFKYLLDMAENNIDHAKLIGTEVSVSIVNEINPTTKENQSKIRWVNPINMKFGKLDVKTLSSLRGDAAPPAADDFDDLPF